MRREQFQERPEDMSSKGSLSLFKQDDGDIIIKVIDERNNEASVEFTTSGGRSPNTMEALQLLFKAMEKDNRPSANHIVPDQFMPKRQK